MRAEREEQRKKRQAELAGDPFSKEVCVPGRLSVPVGVSISSQHQSVLPVSACCLRSLTSQLPE